MDLIKDEDPQAAANYVLRNDLGRVPNGIHRRWACNLLRTLNHTIIRLQRVDSSYIEAATYKPSAF